MIKICLSCKYYWRDDSRKKAICSRQIGLPDVKEDDSCYEWTAKDSVLADSGDRTRFETGAVRDMHQGKGRCDLLPACVLLRLAKHYEAGAVKYSERNWMKGIPAHSFVDSALRHLLKYMDGQNQEDHLIAAIWNLCGLAWTEEKKPEMMDIPERMEAKPWTESISGNICSGPEDGRA